MQIPGVQGYAVLDDRSVQIKLPSKHPFASAKERFRRLYESLAGQGSRVGHTVEILLEEMLITVFMTGPLMLVVMSGIKVNQALLRMTGRLVIAGMASDRGH